MPTIITHGIAAAALGTTFPKRAVPDRLIVAGVVCAIAPDVDVFAADFGCQYGDLLDHRGVTHSIVFAAFVASVAFFSVRKSLSSPKSGALAWIYLFLATVSHGLLDALTDKNGLGIPFFWPFDSTRYFFPFTPIAMSPIGTSFFSERGLVVLLSEVRWVWIPSAVVTAIGLSARFFRAIRETEEVEPDVRRLHPNFLRAAAIVVVMMLFVTIAGYFWQGYHDNHWWKRDYIWSLLIPFMIFPAVVCLAFVPFRLEFTDTEFVIQMPFRQLYTLSWDDLEYYGPGNNVCMIQFSGVGTFQIFTQAFRWSEWRMLTDFLSDKFPDRKTSWYIGDRLFKWGGRRKRD